MESRTGRIRIAASLAVAIAFGIGRHEARAESIESEPNDTPATADPISCDVDTCATLTPGDADVFTFTLPAATNVHLHTTTLMMGDSTTMDLLAADGVTVIASDLGSGIAWGSHIGIARLAAGAYYVRITGGSAFTYALHFLCTNYPVESEPNDAFVTANRLPCARGVSGDFATLNDVDVFGFTVGAASTVIVFMLPSPGNGNMAVGLHDSTGTLLVSGVAFGLDAGVSAPPNVFFPISAGSYFLRFQSIGGTTHYDVQVIVVSRMCIGVTSLAPTSGSSDGGDLVHVHGSGFTSPGTSVRFGGVEASIVSATSDRLDVRTPPGTGSVDVTVSSATDSVTLPSAYAYVDPVLAARYGNVNVGRDDRESTLFVNLETGDPLARVLSVNVGQPITVAMTSPTSLVTASFALYGWVGAPGPATRVVLPGGAGVMAMPPPFVASSPQPVVVFNNSRSRLGTATRPSLPAPSRVIRRASGSPRPITVTLQGIMQDAGSVIPQHFSVTNAIVLAIH